MQVARLAEIHRDPVESMLGGAARVRDGWRGRDLRRSQLGDSDEERGATEGGRKLPSLLHCRARFPDAVHAKAGLPVQLPSP